jgi:hypothetical protein
MGEVSDNLNWKYVKALSDVESINSFESITGFTLPENFKECVKKYNGARPEYKTFDTEKKRERVLKTFLSFNPEDKENVWSYYSWTNVLFKDKYIAFAVDNFGNTLCFNLEGEIFFIGYETLKTEYVASSFEEFLDILY